MPAIQFSGIASGLDTAAIIGSLVAVERIPIQRLQVENATYESKIEIYDSMASSLASLRTAATDLDTVGEFLSYSASSSDDSSVSVTAGGDAVPGSYQVEVSALAQAQKTYSEAFADDTAALSASDETLTLSINGVDTDITVTAGSSLRDVADQINASGADATAGLFYDGTNYRLQVVGRETGAANAVTFTDTGLALGLETPANTVQAAQDAAFTVDGFAVTSSTNTVSGVLAGVTLSLSSTTTSPLTLDIAPDSQAVEDKIQAVVDAYNAVFSVINSQIGQGKGIETLNGDSTMRSIEQGLQRMITSAIPGLTDGDGEQMVLADLGIKTNNDGSLTLDSVALQAKLSDDFIGAAKYFSGDANAATDGMGALLDDLIETYVNTTDGLIEARTDGLNDRIADNDGRIESLELYLEAYEANLQAQFTQLEQSMSALQSQQQYLAQFLQTG